MSQSMSQFTCSSVKKQQSDMADCLSGKVPTFFKQFKFQPERVGIRSFDAALDLVKLCLRRRFTQSHYHFNQSIPRQISIKIVFRPTLRALNASKYYAHTVRCHTLTISFERISIKMCVKLWFIPNTAILVDVFAWYWCTIPLFLWIIEVYDPH
jgi:hypothetical protein